MSHSKILIVDDEARVREAIQRVVVQMDGMPRSVGTAEAAQRLLRSESFDLIITDYMMPGLSGMDLLCWTIEEEMDIPVIMLTGHGSVDHAVNAMRKGASNYLTKPFEVGQLEVAIRQALSVGRLKQENVALKQQLRKISASKKLVGESHALRRSVEVAGKVADSDATVLLTGESGTGKEVFARFIHEAGCRKEKPFVAINCAAIPEHLLESELFGHEKGAFTGADRSQKGKFEVAEDGTVLLDEISEMSPDLQAKLLRVLQEKEFTPVGGRSPIKLEARIVATSNRDLPTAVQNGDFREDLYYRLNVVPLEIPPLRDRPEDIPLLADTFLKRLAAEEGKEIETFSRKAMDSLLQHDWPGNVRELEHTVHRIVLMATGPEVERDDIIFMHSDASKGRSSGSKVCLTIPGDPDDIHDSEDTDFVCLTSLDVREAKGVLIKEALRRTEGNRTQAAKLLGMNPRSLRSILNDS